MTSVVNPPVRCIVFDIDDTLYLERDYVRSGFEAVDALLHARCEVAGFFDRAWSLFQTGLRRTIFNEAIEQLGIAADDDLIAAMVDAYRFHRPTIELLPDARAALDSLAGRAALAAISDGPLASQQAKATALGLAQWCQPIILTESLGPGLGKPHPAAFERVEAETNCQGQECVYIADNPAKDFHAPTTLNWQTIRIRRPGGLHFSAPNQLPVDFEVDNLTSAMEWLQSRLG